MDLTESKSDNANRHFWELSRADMILAEIQNPRGKACMDFGAGDLYFSQRLYAKTHSRVTAFDPMGAYAIDTNELLATNNLQKIDPLKKYDQIFLMDVLEHVEKEEIVLDPIKNLLHAEGTLFITVPAYQFLFSGHDVFLKHFRRYTKSSLSKALEKHGFKVSEIWYFYFSLYLVRILQKWTTPKDKFANPDQLGVGGWGFSEASAPTVFFRFVLNVDFTICKFLSKVGIFLPGLSVYAKCKKNSA
jgi:2-polyprenyl-3-methyl-5-hydroxy-6-metoxy-1,4-benzoquinol methylase